MNYLTNIIKKKSILFFICLFTLMLPLIIVVVGTDRYLSLENEVFLSRLNEEFRILTGNLKNYKNVETFIVKSLYEGYYNFSDTFGVKYDVIALCKEMHNYWKDDFLAVIMDKDNIIYHTDNLPISNNDLREIFKIYYLDDCSKERPEGSLNKFKYLFGKQFTNDTFKYQRILSDNKFIYADNTDEKRPFIMRRSGTLKICIWASKELLNSNKHIEFICKKYANTNKINIGVYNQNDILNTVHLYNHNKLDDEVKNILCTDRTAKQNLSTTHYWLCREYLGKNEFIFSYKPKKYSDITRLVILLFIVIFYILLFGSIFRYFYNKIVLGISKKISIKTKMAVVMVFAASISLFLLSFICKEYETHKKHCLLVETKGYVADRLRDIDGKYEAFLNEIATKVDSKLDSWSKKINGRLLNINDVKELNSVLEPLGINNYYCIASQSSCWIEKTGCYKYSGDLHNINAIDEASERLNASYTTDFNQFKFINLVTKRICADINEVELPQSIMQKLDLIVESISKAGFVEIVYSVINNLGTIKPWGYANRNCMALFKFVNLYDADQSDYLFTCLWNESNLIKLFINHFIPMANRNINNFKYVYYDFAMKRVSDGGKSKQLYDFARKAKLESKDELAMIEIDNISYLISSYKSSNFKNFVFLGLYPLNNIDTDFKNQTYILRIIFALSIVLVLFVICMISNCFLVPLKTLEAKAISIENKKYDSIIETASNDEFGILNETFNEAIEKMKELELAQLVQESMFPDSNFEQQEFEVYGKSQVMTVVGGDYFDIFPVKDNSFVALMGDVAGHGVGASVLMAMAKSAIIAGKDKYASPAAMLNYLHKMVLATKTDKQRKIMTFQYIYVNSMDGNALYGNAGGCAPCIVRNMGKDVEELKMPGAVLGAFKKAVYKELPLQLNHGDALIFYSDGIVEAKNSKGEMLGYDALFEIFKQTYHANPEKYYENIYAKYLEYIKGLEPQDDMTIVIVTRKSKRAKLWNNVELLDLA